MKKFILIIICLYPIFSSCNKEDNFGAYGKDGDNIIFGIIAGECRGDCRNLFIVTPNGLFADADKIVPIDSTLFKRTPMRASHFKLAKTLLDVPLEIELNQINRDHLLRPFADLDYFIKGQVNGHSFYMTFSEIHDSANEDLKLYTSRMINVYEQIAEY